MHDTFSDLEFADERHAKPAAVVEKINEQITRGLAKLERPPQGASLEILRRWHTARLQLHATMTQEGIWD